MSWLADMILARPVPRFWAPGGRWLNRRRRIFRRAMVRARVRPVYIGDDTVLCTALGRYKMYVDSGDLSVSPHLIADGIWEMWVTEAVAALVRPGAVTADVGANLGYFTMIMADLGGAQGQVHAFEPNPRMADLLQRSAVINGLASRVTVHGDPLGDAEGRPLHLVIPDRYNGGGHMVPEEHLRGRANLALATRRLDGVAGAADAEFVKIDAEGSEEAIWDGMSGMIAGTRLSTVLLEFAPERHADPAAFLHRIAGAGFALGYVHETRGMLPATADELMNDRSIRERMLLCRR